MMLKHLLLIFVFASFQSKTKAQNIPSSFTLAGKINAPNGKVTMIPLGFGYYHHFKDHYTTNVVDSNFLIKDTLDFPCPFMIFYENGNGVRKYLSGTFFIDPGIQHIFCNKDSLHEIPKLKNKTMQEYTSPSSFPIRAVYKHDYSESDSALYQYTKKHPASFVALWELIFRISDRYSPTFDSIYSLFSPALKNTYAYHHLGEKLEVAKSISPGKHFPSLLLRSISDLSELKPIAGFKKYTLVDFWFAHCGACLSEFPELKNIYTSYSPKGFNIIGISRDNKDMIKDWEGVVKKYRLPWTQYLDVNGKEMLNLEIYQFPTNFLLDSNGKIIKRDIEPVELAGFLKKNLK